MIVRSRDKYIMLRLPVKPQSIFLSKLLTLYILDLLICSIFIIPINSVFAFVIRPGISFYLYTILILVCLPTIPFFLSTILVIPYIKLLDFFRNKFFLTLIAYVALLGLFFFGYLRILGVFQRLLETGSIKFLFNEKFINTLQLILKYNYPLNGYVNILFGQNILQSILFILITCIVDIVVSYFLSKLMFYKTLYKNEVKPNVMNSKKFRKEHSQLSALIRKEFLNVFRNPKYLFSYFAISIFMPFMVFGTFQMFDTLLENALGVSIDFELALLLVLIFAVLTNTFCSTNISRDGIAFLKMKAFPATANIILMAKVLFCFMVSFISMLLTSFVLFFILDISILNVLFIFVVGILFSLGQILIATKIDLNNAKISIYAFETEKESSKTIAKVVIIGFVLASVGGLEALVFRMLYMFMNLSYLYVGYLLSFITIFIYAVSAYLFYRYKLVKRFDRIVC